MEPRDVRRVEGSHRILKKLIGDRVPYVSEVLRRSAAQVTKWLLPPATKADPNQSGEINPVDMLVTLLRCGDEEVARDVVDWICLRFGGRFVPRDGGQGDGRLFRGPEDAVSHLKAIVDELKKKGNASPQVVQAHLDEAFCVLTSWAKDKEQNDAGNANGHDKQA